MSVALSKSAVYKGNKTFSIEPVEIRAPGPNAVQVAVAYCGICGTDMHVFHGNMDARVGFSRVIGHEMSGTVRALGDGVTGLSVGDKVVVRPLDHCGTCPACLAGHTHICHDLTFLGLDSDGAFGEYWTVPAHTVHRLPDAMPLDHAALVEPLAVACHDVRLSRLNAGEYALVIGGGPIGMLIAMVARTTGAQIAIAEPNPSRRALAHALGFTVFDPTCEDVAASVTDATGGAGAHVVFEVSGTQAGVDTMTACAATRARIVMVAVHTKKPEVDLFRFFWRELQLVGARVYEVQDYDRAIDLMSGRAVAVHELITDRFVLSDIQSAFENLDGNPSSMKTLIRCGAGPTA